jgi:DNA modification methylase
MAKLILKSRHRVMCGNSTSAQDVATLMDGATASLLFTSPPYAQQRDYGAAKEAVSDWDALMQGVFGAALVAPDAQILVNLGLVHRANEWVPYWDAWIEWMRQQGWRRFGWYVWDQGPGLMGDWNGRFAPSHEFIFHFNREARRPNKTVENKSAGKPLAGGGLRGGDGVVKRKTGEGDAIQTHRIPDSVVRVSRHHGAVPGGAHPAVFSVAFAEEIIRAFTDEGEVVFEPFSGSGTQVVAAERSGRRCYAMELDPAYVDVACRRWAIFSGEDAVNSATQQTFSEAANGEAHPKVDAQDRVRGQHVASRRRRSPGK